MFESDTVQNMFVQKYFSTDLLYIHGECNFQNKNFYSLRRFYIAVGYELSRLSKNYILTM